MSKSKSLSNATSSSALTTDGDGEGEHSVSISGNHLSSLPGSSLASRATPFRLAIKSEWAQLLMMVHNDDGIANMSSLQLY